MKSCHSVIASCLSVAMMFMANVCIDSALAADQPGQTERIIKITAKRFEFSPNEIRIKKGVPVVLEFTSLDRTHGFTVPDLGGYPRDDRAGEGYASANHGAKAKAGDL